MNKYRGSNFEDYLDYEIEEVPLNFVNASCIIWVSVMSLSQGGRRCTQRQKIY